MPVTMICPNLNCRHTVVAPDAMRGKMVRCAQCKQLFIVPERGRAEAAAAVTEAATKPKREKDENA